MHIAVIVVALLPAAWGLGALASDFFRGTRMLGSEPIKELESLSLFFLAPKRGLKPMGRPKRDRPFGVNQRNRNHS